MKNVCHQVACPFLDIYDVAFLLKRFANEPSYYPVWLNNDGQNLIAFLPKSHFTVYFSEQANIFKLVSIINENQSEQLVTAQQLEIHLIDYYQNQSIPDNKFLQDKAHYQEGLIGYISYDFSAFCLAKLDKKNLDFNKPCAYFGHYPIFLQNIAGRWYLISYTKSVDELVEISSSLVNVIVDEEKASKFSVVNQISAIWQYKDYQQAFNKVQDYLYAGDCYQINLTQCWQGQIAQPLVAGLSQFHSALTAPFSGYLGYFQGDLAYEIVSCSPELFFTFFKSDSGIKLVTKPIKGTRPRHENFAKDEYLKNELKNSEKDTAENVMIVDLLRNDLGKYAKIGSVSVPKLFDIESFSNVHHMVSTITATIKSDVHPLTVLFGSLPAGSITGTPKKRAVEIIHELESDNRGAYCGTMGYLNFAGDGQWNVLIRTLQSYKKTDKYLVSLWAGGGITIASDCQAEYQECFDKVSNLLNTFNTD